MTSFPNRDGEGILLNWAVNPNIEKEKVYKAGYVHLQK